MAAKKTIKKTKVVDRHHLPAIKTISDSKGNTIVLEAKFPYEVRECGTSWTVYSPHFNTLGYSRTSETEAVADFKEAIQTFFDVHYERGTLEKALIHFGWIKRNNALQKPKLFNRPVRSGVTRREFNLSELQLA